MKSRITGTEFGSITIDGNTIDHDVVVRLDGKVDKRRKKLSKAVHGSSHIVSRDEAEHVYEDGARWIIIGSGQHGALRLSDEADAFFADRSCAVDLAPTPEAVCRWNEAEGDVIGLFHVTC